MSKIDCLLISTGRAASTAIYRYLSIAGDLNLPKNKEPHYWCDVREHQGLYPALLRIYTEDTDAYWDLYADAKLKLDASCGYFFYIDEVIEKLRAQKQEPQVIFLYREPVRRAASFFNELKKKDLTSAETFEQDLARSRGDGLWWEYYYDNVRYDQCFCKMQDYFKHIIAVNYDHFAQDQKAVLKALLRFLDMPTDRVDHLQLEPINSSQQALAKIYERKHPILRSVGKRLPSPMKRLIRSGLGSYLGGRHNDAQTGVQQIEAYLPNSLAEYNRFRERIGYQDLVTWHR